MQRLVVENLSELHYKIHTGLFVEDILLKLHTHIYDVVNLQRALQRWGSQEQSDPAGGPRDFSVSAAPTIYRDGGIERPHRQRDGGVAV
jgi:hypothetical protein